MPQILLVGSELPLLEGLSQSFAALGFAPVVAQTLHEARELAAAQAPLVAVVSRRLAAESSAETLSIPLSRGRRARALLHGASRSGDAVADDAALGAGGPHAAARAQPAVALVQHLEDRARATGRGGGAEDETRIGDRPDRRLSWPAHRGRLRAGWNVLSNCP